jgi:hypothetical protein
MFHKCCHYNDSLIRDLVKKSKANNCWRKCDCVRESCGPHEPELLIFLLKPQQALRILYLLGLLFYVPIQFFPALEILEASLKKFLARQLTTRAIVSFRLLVCVFCTLVAIICRDYFGYFTSIIGSIG